MNVVKWWRQRGWLEISKEDYLCAHVQFGGSVITHPEFIDALSHHLDIPLHYAGHYHNNVLMAAVPLWGSAIAGSKHVLKSTGCYDQVDIGNMEIILPIAPQANAIPLRFRGQYISSLNARHLASLRAQKETLSMLKSYSRGEFSKKFLYNRSRELRLLQEANMSVLPISSFTTDEIAQWYIELFEMRWNRKPKAHHAIHSQLQIFKEFLTGHVLLMQDKPISMQLIFHASSPQWISFEFLNAGIDPSHQKLSPGSVLTYVNTLAADQLATTQGKDMRYSFGRTDEEYKSLWCHAVPVYAR